MSRWIFSLVALTACFDGSNVADDDIVGPYTGARTRYVVDRMVLPLNNAQARQYGGDLNNDKTTDNQLGMVISTLIGQGVGDEHLDDRIAGGEITTVVEIQADNFVDDDRVGVWVYGFDGAEAEPIGGAFVGGTFVPNFVRETALENVGIGIVKMPVIAEVDASLMHLDVMEMSLVPDGNGGWDGQIHGALPDALAIALAAIEQQLHDQPEYHRWMWTLMDPNRDGVISPSEHNTLIESLMYPDLKIGGEQLLSVGFGVHLIPCAAGRCAAAPPEAPCFDRVRDGDETDVDCGGSCGRRCPADLACVDGGDCQSGTCSAGVCTTPTCFDGVKNGYEAAADCGGSCARKCSNGAVCGFQWDCASGRCSMSSGSGTGVCTP